ncbi:MAG: hypothetical protein IAE79_01505 [Anaerolinea sp.]|nr:hypothetical protein [Anaerolinea sp.]
MDNKTMQYASYLVRLWREDRSETAVESATHYRAEVEHIQTGHRRQFHTPDDLWAFLNRAVPTGEYDAAFNE